MKNPLVWIVAAAVGLFLWLRFRKTSPGSAAGVPAKSGQTTGDAAAPGIFGLFGGWGAPQRLPSTSPAGGGNAASSGGSGNLLNALADLAARLARTKPAGDAVNSIQPGRVYSNEQTAYVTTSAQVPGLDVAIEAANATPAAIPEDRRFSLDDSQDFGAPQYDPANTYNVSADYSS